MMEFGKGYWKTFEEGVQREWVIANGVGGYCGGSIIGANARRHHAYLVASLHAPVERNAFVNKSDEVVTFMSDGKARRFSLATNQRVGGWNEDGCRYLQRFVYDELPHFVYQVGGMFMTKTLAMEWEKNTVAVCYEVQNGNEKAVISITPFFTAREYGNGMECGQLKFEEEFESDTILKLVPENKPNCTITCHVSEGTFIPRVEKFDSNMVLQIEINTGGNAIENSYTPYDIQVDVEPFEKKKFCVIYSVEDSYEPDGFETMKHSIARIQKVVSDAGYDDDFANSLVQAADQFIVKRSSTSNKTVMAGYPWFTDWGRDTMIALQGLTLATKRFADARSILRSFAMYVKEGLVPNMFPDEGVEPFYNTADASMWYFYSVDKYLEYTGTEADYEFIKKDIYEKLEEIIHFYSVGTQYSIYMDEDGLISAGGGYDQVTWMDVRVGTWVVTPRHGKPVEINALWYNALCVMEKLAKKFGGPVSVYGKTSEEYAKMAQQAKESFVEKFWNEEKQCLYDVVGTEGRGNEDHIRCNQIYAVSLPYTMLSPEKEKKVVDLVIEKLYATYGLRTLSQDDPDYQPYYRGKLHDRDAAYHQGTAWAFPLGALVTAYMKVYDDREYAKKLLEPMKDHLRDGCIGSIAEIFDGEEPNISRGTYAQAWSVGEILRAYTEDIL